MRYPQSTGRMEKAASRRSLRPSGDGCQPRPLKTPDEMGSPGVFIFQSPADPQDRDLTGRAPVPAGAEAAVAEAPGRRPSPGSPIRPGRSALQALAEEAVVAVAEEAVVAVARLRRSYRRGSQAHCSSDTCHPA